MELQVGRQKESLQAEVGRRRHMAIAGNCAMWNRFDGRGDFDQSDAIVLFV